MRGAEHTHDSREEVKIRARFRDDTVAAGLLRWYFQVMAQMVTSQLCIQVAAQLAEDAVDSPLSHGGHTADQGPEVYVYLAYFRWYLQVLEQLAGFPYNFKNMSDKEVSDRLFDDAGRCHVCFR